MAAPSTSPGLQPGTVLNSGDSLVNSDTLLSSKDTSLTSLTTKQLMLLVLWNLSCSSALILSVSALLRKAFGLYVVGLTGSISTGKSTCLSYIRRQLIRPAAENGHIDFDVIGHEQYAPGNPVWSAVVREFSEDAIRVVREGLVPLPDHIPSLEELGKPEDTTIEGSPVLQNNPLLTADKSINRKVLGTIVWQSKDKLKVLVGLTQWPIIRDAAMRALYAMFLTQSRSVFLDNALLIEAKLNWVCDETLVIYVPRKLQVQRLMERDKLESEDQAMSKIDKQMSVEDKVKFATRVIDNSSKFEDGAQQAIDEWMDARKTELRMRRDFEKSGRLSWSYALVHPTKLSLVLSSAILGFGYLSYRVIDYF